MHVADHCGNVLFKDGQPTFVVGNMALQNFIHKGLECWHWLRRWFTLPPSQCQYQNGPTPFHRTLPDTGIAMVSTQVQIEILLL